jgi:hypothetical protein
VLIRARKGFHQANENQIKGGIVVMFLVASSYLSIHLIILIVSLSWYVVPLNQFAD